MDQYDWLERGGGILYTFGTVNGAGMHLGRPSFPKVACGDWYWRHKPWLLLGNIFIKHNHPIRHIWDAARENDGESPLRVAFRVRALQRYIPKHETSGLYLVSFDKRYIRSCNLSRHDLLSVGSFLPCVISWRLAKAYPTERPWYSKVLDTLSVGVPLFLVVAINSRLSLFKPSIALSVKLTFCYMISLKGTVHRRGSLVSWLELCQRAIMTSYRNWETPMMNDLLKGARATRC